MLNEITHLLPTIEHFQGAVYWAAFAAALVETALVVGLLIPGSTLLLILGAASATGRFDFSALLAFAVAGAILGDNLNYWLGRRYGQRWMQNGNRILKQEHFDNARSFFNRHGARSIFLGRFVPTIKELVPFVAGSVSMRQRTFLFWNALGAIGWGLEWLGAGYLFARSITLAQLWLTRVGLLVATILVLSLLIWWSKRLVYRYGQPWLRFTASIWHSVKNAISRNPEFRQVVDDHPRLFMFLAARFDRTHFSGRPLTLAVFAFSYVLILFAGIVEDLLSKDPIVTLDHYLAQVLATLRTDRVIQFFIWITELGMWQVVVPVVLITTTILWMNRRPWLIAGLLTSVVGGIGFTMLGKLAFHRPRPQEALLIEHSYAFPSGHATIAIALYGFLGYLLIRQSNTWRTRVNWFFSTLVLVLLIGLSRLVLGVHYLSDVWSGYLVGALWLIVGISLNEWLTSFVRIPGRIASRTGITAASYGLIVLGVSIYLGFAALYQPALTKPTLPPAQTISVNPVDGLAAKIPAYTETAFGQRQLPLSLVLIARNQSILVDTFLQSGWHQPEKPGLRPLPEQLKSDRSIVQAPLPPAFWNGHLNELAFEKETGAAGSKQTIAVQIWRTPYNTPQGQVFVGIAKGFVGLRWRIFRTLNPDLDEARDAVTASLRSTQHVLNEQPVPFVAPLVGKNVTGSPFFSRGEIQLIFITAQGARSTTLSDTHFSENSLRSP